MSNTGMAGATNQPPELEPRRRRRHYQAPFLFKNRFAAPEWKYGPKPSDREPSADPDRKLWNARVIVETIAAREAELIGRITERANRRLNQAVAEAEEGERQWRRDRESRYSPIISALVEAERQGKLNDKSTARLLEIIRDGKLYG